MQNGDVRLLHEPRDEFSFAGFAPCQGSEPVLFEPMLKCFWGFEG